MPYYYVHGRGIKTGKSRKHGPWYARTEWEIRERAANDEPETEVLRLEELPHGPPSESQLRLCKHKNISVLPIHTKYDVSYLISCEIEPLASKNQMMVLDSTGYSLGKYEPPTEKRVVYLLDHHFGDRQIAERARWYVYSVARYLARGTWITPGESGIPDVKIREIVTDLLSEKKFKNQFKRGLYDEEGRCQCGHPAYDLDHHGGNELQRMTFIRARQLITAKLSLIQRRGKLVGNAAPDIRGLAQKALWERQARSNEVLLTEWKQKSPDTKLQSREKWLVKNFWWILGLSVCSAVAVTHSLR